MLINPSISGSWESLGSPHALGMAVSITYFNGQWGWTCVYGWTPVCMGGPCISEACSAPGATVGSGRISGFWIPRRVERDRAGRPAADGGITAHRKWLKLDCGFALPTKWLFTGSVSSASSCVYPRLREHWGTSQRDLRFLWAHAMLPARPNCSVCPAFGTHS